MLYNFVLLLIIFFIHTTIRSLCYFLNLEKYQIKYWTAKQRVILRCAFMTGLSCKRISDFFIAHTIIHDQKPYLCFYFPNCLCISSVCSSLAAKSNPRQAFTNHKLSSVGLRPSRNPLSECLEVSPQQRLCLIHFLLWLLVLYGFKLSGLNCCTLSLIFYRKYIFLKIRRSSNNFVCQNDLPEMTRIRKSCKNLVFMYQMILLPPAIGIYRIIRFESWIL